MKQYRTITIPEHKEQITAARICDLCGFTSTRDDWNGGVYDVDETEIKITIRQKEGESYPDGGSGTECEVDLCPTCFKDKLIPWLKSQGADIKPIEWDW